MSNKMEEYVTDRLVAARYVKLAQRTQHIVIVFAASANHPAEDNFLLQVVWKDVEEMHCNEYSSGKMEALWESSNQQRCECYKYLERTMQAPAGHVQFSVQRSDPGLCWHAFSHMNLLTSTMNSADVLRASQNHRSTEQSSELRNATSLCTSSSQALLPIALLQRLGAHPIAHLVMRNAVYLGCGLVQLIDALQEALPVG